MKFLLIILLVKYILNNTVIKIPFKTEIDEKQIYVNNIYINLKIGTPSQEVKLYINFNSTIFIINKNIFKDSSSKTFIKYYKYTEYYIPKIGKIYQGSISKDYINLENYNKTKIEFILGDFIYNNISGYIGLKYINKGDNSLVENIIQQLKTQKIINNYYWCLKYNNKNEGEFIIGKEELKSKKNEYMIFI